MNSMKHKAELDDFTPSEIRVLCEELLYTMEIEQRRKIMVRHPGLYMRLYGEDTMDAIMMHMKDGVK